MEKFKFDKDRPQPSSEQIAKGMDFNKIAKSLPSKSSGLKTKLIVAGIVGAAIVLFTVFIKNSGDEVIPRTKPVLVNAENEAKAFAIDASKDTSILFDTGSEIVLSKNSFVDDKGNDIVGEVSITYREFHNVGEILLSGIPMEYDSAGYTYNFESAGMFEVYATQKGKPVFIKKDKALEIKMASLNADKGKFNQYYLSHRDSAWKYVKPDESITLSNASMLSTNAKDTIKAMQDIIKPILLNKNKDQFVIEIPKMNYSELSVYKDVMFEMSSDNKKLDIKKTMKDWPEVSIVRLNKKEYKITFADDKESYEVIAYPVFDTLGYNTAMKTYKDELAKFDQAIGENEKAIGKRGEALNSELDKYTAIQTNYASLMRSRSMLLNKAFETGQVIYRTFQVREFGIWNSDCPSALPEGAELMASYKNDKGEVVKPEAIYLVEKSKNAAFSFYVDKKLKFNPAAQNVLIVVLSNNTLGYVNANVLSSISTSAKKYTFNLTIIKKDNYTLSDINTIIS